MKTYQDVKAKIAALEKEAETLLQRELGSVIAQVKKTIAQYGLSAADLGLGRAAAPATRRKAAAKGRKATTVGMPKYQDPKTMKTWTGRGKPPTWIVGVANRDDYLIGAPAPTTPAATPKAKPGRKAAAPAKSAKGKKPTKAPAKSGRGRKAANSAAVQIEGGVAAQ